MHAFGRAGESGGLVAQQMGETCAADVLQDGLDGHAGIESYSLGMDRHRARAGDVGETVSAFRFAAAVDPQRRRFEELEGEVVKCGRVAAFELELDFADRLDRAAVDRADLADIDGRLDPGPRRRLDVDGFAGDLGDKERG